MFARGMQAHLHHALALEERALVVAHDLHALPSTHTASSASCLPHLMLLGFDGLVVGSVRVVLGVGSGDES